EPSPPPSQTGELFALELGLALHRYGAPAHRLEDALTACASRMGLESAFFAVPTALMAGFGPGPGVWLRRPDVSRISLGKMVAVDEIASGVARGTVTPDQGLGALRKAEAEPSPYRGWSREASSAVAGGAAAALLGGGPNEVVVATGIGALAGLVGRLLARDRDRARLAEAAAGLLAALLVGVVASLPLPIARDIAIVAGLIA